MGRVVNGYGESTLQKENGMIVEEGFKAEEGKRIIGDSNVRDFNLPR